MKAAGWGSFHLQLETPAGITVTPIFYQPFPEASSSEGWIEKYLWCFVELSFKNHMFF
jgi:hypothetical protein